MFAITLPVSQAWLNPSGGYRGVSYGVGERYFQDLSWVSRRAAWRTITRFLMVMRGVLKCKECYARNAGKSNGEEGKKKKKIAKKRPNINRQGKEEKKEVTGAFSGFVIIFM